MTKNGDFGYLFEFCWHYSAYNEMVQLQFFSNLVFETMGKTEIFPKLVRSDLLDLKKCNFSKLWVG